MQSLRRWEVFHIAACVLCAGLGWRFTDPLEGTEFSGGWLTGPLLTVHGLSIVLFLLSAALIVVYRRAAVIIGFVACISALPLYTYFIIPGVFHSVFRGESSVPAPSFVANGWALAGIAAVCAAAYTALKASRVSRRM